MKGDKVYNLHKRKRIHEALRRKDNIDLCLLAISTDGLINDVTRRKVWPKLLDIDVLEFPPKPDIEAVKCHHYYTQVVLDVNRALRRFPPSIAEKQRLALQDQLVILIVRVLMKNPELHYYQGYHDICVTFLMVLGEELAFAVVERLSVRHLSDFMDISMEKTSDLLYYLYPIIGRENPKLRCHLERSDVGVIFCLSWVITWFGHVLSNYNTVVRLYDFFLACDSLMPIYFSAALVLYREDELMNVECDMAMMHHTLSQIPDDLPFEELVSFTSQLYIKYPPDELHEDHHEIIEEKNRLLRIDQELRQTRLNAWNRKHKGILKTSFRAFTAWFGTTSKYCRWPITLTTGTIIFITVFAIIYRYVREYNPYYNLTKLIGS